jgi:hypothetical protein
MRPGSAGRVNGGLKEGARGMAGFSRHGYGPEQDVRSSISLTWRHRSGHEHDGVTSRSIVCRDAGSAAGPIGRKG